jgi:hypothetical protein
MLRAAFPLTFQSAPKIQAFQQLHPCPRPEKIDLGVKNNAQESALPRTHSTLFPSAGFRNYLNEAQETVLLY